MIERHDLEAGRFFWTNLFLANHDRNVFARRRHRLTERVRRRKGGEEGGEESGEGSGKAKKSREASRKESGMVGKRKIAEKKEKSGKPG